MTECRWCLLGRASQRWSQHVYVGRGIRGQPLLGAPGWGNPFKLTQWSWDESLAKYRAQVQESALRDRLRTLAGRILVCKCAPGQRCHADVLICLFGEEIGVARVVYVGHGSEATKQRSKWASPVVPGRCHTYQEVVLTHADWLLGESEEASQLCSQAGELRGCALACGRPLNEPCHAEVLAAGG